MARRKRATVLISHFSPPRFPIAFDTLREGLWFFHKESVPQIKRGALQLEPPALDEAREHLGAGFIQSLLFEGAAGHCPVVILAGRAIRMDDELSDCAIVYRAATQGQNRYPK